MSWFERLIDEVTVDALTPTGRSFSMPGIILDLARLIPNGGGTVMTVLTHVNLRAADLEATWYEKYTLSSTRTDSGR